MQLFPMCITFASENREIACDASLLLSFDLFTNKVQYISDTLLSVAMIWMKNFEVNRRMSPDSVTFFFILFYKYDFVVGLLQGFLINVHESGSNSPGVGTFSRDLTKTKSLHCRDFTWSLHVKKSISP